MPVRKSVNRRSIKLSEASSEKKLSEVSESEIYQIMNNPKGLSNRDQIN